MSNKYRVPIQSTAGAIPVRNEKGEISMEKVKVSRYVTGKRPEYAPESSSDDDSDDDNFKLDRARPPVLDRLRADDDEKDEGEEEVTDRRLRRMQDREAESDEERLARHRRQVTEPEVVSAAALEDEGGAGRERRRDDEESSEEEEELEEEEIERRRTLLRQRAIQRREEEVLRVEAEKSDGSGSEDESSEYEEYTDSEEEETGPRLKPVFVRKKDRVTIQEKEHEEQKQIDLEQDQKRLAEERRKQTLRMVAEEVQRETEKERHDQDPIDAIDSGEENDEEEYEAWKLRELKRIKRDRDAKETIEKEKLEIERTRNLPEEERRQEFRQNPKLVTNRMPKGKYKFLQKYYHRGAFFMNEEEGVFSRDNSAPTLEDHFDKTILPKVMQVKNFGRSGRTKYTHLVDQDTTEFEATLGSETQNLTFHTAKSGGIRQTFERPSQKKKK